MNHQSWGGFSADTTEKLRPQDLGRLEQQLPTDGPGITGGP